MSEKIDFEGLADKRNILLLIGCYCNNPKLILDKKYETTHHDYPENFHKMIFGIIYNISKKNNVTKITPVEIENEASQFKNTLKLWEENKGWEYIEEALSESENKLLNIGLYHDNVKKYSILRNAVSTMKMDISFIYDPEDDNKTNVFNQMTSVQLLSEFYNRFDEFKKMWNENFGDNYSFHISEDIDDIIESYKNQENVWGFPYQNDHLNTITRGMRDQKFVLESSKSGGGKSRIMLGDLSNIASEKLYDWETKKWVDLGESQSALFISTELTKEEVNTCVLAHISGVEQDKIEEWIISKEEEQIIYEASIVMKNSKLHCEYMSDFTIDTIRDTIERYVINEGIKYVAFDYINDSSSIYEYYIKKTGIRLQTHQILFLLGMELKLICNKYHVFMKSATQLSNNYKDEKDASALKGSKSLAEKLDVGIIILPTTSSDLKKLDPIFRNGFYKVPNMARYIYKNRGGKWNNIIIWSQINLGTCREMSCFCTDMDFNLIQLPKTEIGFSITNIGNVVTISTDDNESIGEFVEEFKHIK